VGWISILERIILGFTVGSSLQESTPDQPLENFLPHIQIEETQAAGETRYTTYAKLWTPLILGRDYARDVRNRAEGIADRLNTTEVVVEQTYGIMTLWGGDHPQLTPYEAFITHMYIGRAVRASIALYDRVEETRDSEEFTIAGFHVPIDQTGDADFLLVEFGLGFYDTQWNCLRFDASARFTGGFTLETLKNEDESGNLIGGGGDPLVIGGVVARGFARCDFGYFTDAPFFNAMSIGGNFAIGYLNIFDSALEMFYTPGDILLNANISLAFRGYL
jgi:hypothetical protein